jgi:uncharacterized membrane protein
MNLDDERPSVVFRELGSRVELPPTRLAVAELMSVGRRVRRRRRVALGGTGVLGLGLAAVVGVTFAAGPHQPDSGVWPVAQVGASTPASAGALGPCAIERLPVPAGAANVDVTAGASGGRYLVGNVYSKGLARPVLWDGEKVTTLTVAGSVSAEAQGVNDSGVLVGEAAAHDGGSFGWAYVGGRVVTLPTPTGYASAEATAVNAHGDVVGNAYDGTHPTTAVVWRGLGGTVTVHPLAAPGSAIAFGISDAGVVVGELESSGAYAWNANGEGHELPNLPGTAGGRAQGVRGEWAYGTVMAKNVTPPAAPPARQGARGAGHGARGPVLVDPNTAVLWDLRTNHAIEIAGDGIGAITSSGQALVNTDDSGAVLRGADGTSRALPGLTPDARSQAAAISDDGTLVAGFSLDRASSQPVRWHC